VAVLPDVASTRHSQVTATASAMVAGVETRAIHISPRDRFRNARNTSGDGRQICVRVRPVNSTDLRSCSVCEAQAMYDASGNQPTGQCQLGKCGKLCASDDLGGVEFIYNGSVALPVVMDVLLVSSGFVSCEGNCVPIGTCFDVGHTLAMNEPCSALSIDQTVGAPSVLTIVPGRTGKLRTH